MSGGMKWHSGKLAAAAAAAILIAAVLHGLGIIPFWVFAAVLIVAFPSGVLALFMWWMADEKEGDIPFIGY